ncbi:N-acetylmuramoyl-L-alanine amidase [uncultured Kiloniella sp.]|uniref:N-acetylmuramoyl-L-alanine amidase n=1 Tax=uncultured Kiloniella sp. TaxID=1133091 RepID=UPI00261C6C6D|nr:N-acetylmuramoyl-L-alanine amidase [uncultured Kiloniella sp.]
MKINHTYHSPNFGPRPKTVDINMLLLHYTGMQTGKEALERLCDSAAQVSAHYLIEEDGEIFQLVPEEHRAWHAGLAYWHDETDINSCSIGIEIVNPGHEWGYRPFPTAQMKAVATLSKEILERHSIPSHRVLAHSDVAPERKEDPGELFDWIYLANQGIGVFPDGTAQSSPIAEDSFVLKLGEYGYKVDIKSPTGSVTKAAIIAFQRHFRPSKLNGEIDQECCQILADLYSQLDDS